MTRPLDVLIADDEHDAADMMAEMLATYLPAARFRVAYTGEEAVQMSEASQPDIAILDLEMPGMGGEAAAYAMRSSSSGSALRLIALSGNIMRLTALRQVGPFNHLMSKPVDVPAMVELLRRNDHHA